MEDINFQWPINPGFCWILGLHQFGKMSDRHSPPKKNQGEKHHHHCQQQPQQQQQEESLFVFASCVA